MLDADQDFAYIHCVCPEPKCFCVRRAKIPAHGKLAQKIMGKKDYVLPCTDCKAGKHQFNPIDAGYGVVDDIMGFTREKMADSDAVLMVMQGNYDGRQTLELGLAMMLGRPIILVIVAGAKVSDKILAAADEVIYMDTPNEQAIQRAAREVYRRMGKGKPN